MQFHVVSVCSANYLQRKEFLSCFEPLLNLFIPMISFTVKLRSRHPSYMVRKTVLFFQYENMETARVIKKSVNSRGVHLHIQEARFPLDSWKCDWTVELTTCWIWCKYTYEGHVGREISRRASVCSVFLFLGLSINLVVPWGIAWDHGCSSIQLLSYHCTLQRDSSSQKQMKEMIESNKNTELNSLQIKNHCFSDMLGAKLQLGLPLFDSLITLSPDIHWLKSIIQVIHTKKNGQVYPKN